jgi:hypothetical protein
VTELVGGLLDGSGSGSSGSGSGSSGQSEPQARAETGTSSPAGSVSTIATHGTTFPVSEEEGVPAIAFNERGIAVSPDAPDDWGSGAGAVYLTDNDNAVYAAVVSSMGELRVVHYEPATSSWK